MAAIDKRKSEFIYILSEAFSSIWLPIIFFLNGFLTGFLLPTQQLEAGYTAHHWDFVYALTGALLLALFRWLIKQPDLKKIVLSFVSSGVLAAFAPFLWSYLVLPNGIPDDFQDKWVYAFNGPIGQIVLLALLVGTIRYSRRVSNAVTDSGLSLNHIRSEMQTQIAVESENISNKIRERLEPVIASMQSSVNSGAKLSEIVSGIDNTINEVVRPLSYELDESAAKSTFTLNRKEIKRELRKARFSRVFKQNVPLKFIFSAPLSIFCYVNFALSVVSFVHGVGTAVAIGIPFLAITIAILYVLNRFSRDRVVKLPLVLLLSTLISVVQGLVFFALAVRFNIYPIEGENVGLGISVFAMTIVSSIYQIIIYRMRINLEAQTNLDNEIAHDLSIVRHRLWALRKRFAREIHSGLQSKFQVLALRAAKEEALDHQSLNQLFGDIKHSLAFDNTSTPENDIKKYLEELVDFWEGVAEIQVSVDSELLDLLKEEYLLVECLQEVIRESINNAIKHSAANQIQVSIQSKDDKTVVLRVENNVKQRQDNEATGSGLGTKIISELSKSWSFKKDGETGVLSAEFSLR